MPFQVMLPMVFRFAPGSPDVEGDVLLRKSAFEFLYLKASDDKKPCTASLEDQHTVGRTKIQRREHRSQQKPLTYMQLSDRLRRRQFKLPPESLPMTGIRNPPIPRIFANLLRQRQNGFQVFSRAGSLPGVEP